MTTLHSPDLAFPVQTPIKSPLFISTKHARTPFPPPRRNYGGGGEVSSWPPQDFPASCFPDGPWPPCPEQIHVWPTSRPSSLPHPGGGGEKAPGQRKPLLPLDAGRPRRCRSSWGGGQHRCQELHPPWSPRVIQGASPLPRRPLQLVAPRHRQGAQDAGGGVVPLRRPVRRVKRGGGREKLTGARTAPPAKQKPDPKQGGQPRRLQPSSSPLGRVEAAGTGAGCAWRRAITLPPRPAWHYLHRRHRLRFCLEPPERT